MEIQVTGTLIESDCVTVLTLPQNEDKKNKTKQNKNEVASTKLIVVYYFFCLFVIMLLTSPYELKVSDKYSPKVCVRNEWEGYRWLGDGKSVYGYIFAK